MKTNLIAAAGCGLLLAQAAIAGGAAAAAAAGAASNADKVSYGMGVYAARNFKYQGIELDENLLIQGIKDGLAGRKLAVPEKDLRQAMAEYQTQLRQKQAKNHMVASTANKQKGDAFRAANKDKPGVTTLTDGVQYAVLAEGDGKKPGDGDSVEVNYRGTLIDGTEFDATEPGHPALLKLSNLIPGWREALKMMPAGSKWQIVVPPEQAYGERGVGHDIGPNATLMFDVELVAIK